MFKTLKTIAAELKRAKTLIYVASTAIPVVVAVLFKVKIEGVDFSFLPPIYAGINGLTAVLLVAALIAIKKGKMPLHRSLMRFSLLLSLLFLASYVAYHMNSDSTSYGRAFQTLYYIILV